jgi:hypothetical protein
MDPGFRRGDNPKDFLRDHQGLNAPYYTAKNPNFLNRLGSFGGPMERKMPIPRPIPTLPFIGKR